MIHKIYFGEDGFINHSRTIYSDIDPDPEDGIIVPREVKPSIEYYANGEILLKPESPITVDGCVLTNIPNPTTITVDGVSYVITDYSLELEFDTPGTHKIYIHGFPFLDKEFTIET